MKRIAIATGLVLATASGLPAAHEQHGQANKAFDAAAVEQTPFGHAGDPVAANRTMTISMSDTMRFSPTVLTIRRGETVRFVVRNEGKAMHEMVLGTEDDLAKHAEFMLKFPDMEHDAPHMVHVEPGRSGDMVWTFNRAGEFRFACLVPGHFEAGMVGTIIVK